MEFLGCDIVQLSDQGCKNSDDHLMAANSSDNSDSFCHLMAIWNFAAQVWQLYNYVVGFDKLNIQSVHICVRMCICFNEQYLVGCLYFLQAVIMNLKLLNSFSFSSFLMSSHSNLMTNSWLKFEYSTMVSTVYALHGS